MHDIEVLVFRAIVIRRFCMDACEKSPALSDGTNCPGSRMLSIEASQKD